MNFSSGVLLSRIFITNLSHCSSIDSTFGGRTPSIFNRLLSASVNPVPLFKFGQYNEEICFGN